MYNLTAIDRKALISVSSSLGILPKKLYILIQFESKWNPQALNRTSGARGLIQFMPKTARSMGYVDSLDLVRRHPTIKSQLEGPVYNYLKAFKPFTGDQSLFFSVFYPKARTWPLYKSFPKYVQNANPGIRTPADYMRKVYRSSDLLFLPPFLILIGIGTILYITYTKKKGGKRGTTKTIEGRK